MIPPMGDAPSLLAELLELDLPVLRVEVAIEGRVESAAREGAADDADGSPGTVPMREPDSKIAVSKRARRAASRDVVIRRGHSWRIVIGCRGGQVSVELEAKGDPLDAVAAVSEILDQNGR